MPISLYGEYERRDKLSFKAGDTKKLIFETLRQMDDQFNEGQKVWFANVVTKEGEKRTIWTHSKTLINQLQRCAFGEKIQVTYKKNPKGRHIYFVDILTEEEYGEKE